MHIIAVCPFCQTNYQVQPALRGQKILCPNATCRKVFMIAPEQASKAGDGQRSGTVGDMVPILSAEPVTPPAGVRTASKHVSEVLPLAPAESVAPAVEAKSTEGDWWQGPPAVRQTPSRPAASPPAVPSSPPSTAPVEGGWWRDALPPARHPQNKTEPVKPPKEPAPRSAALTQPMPATVLETPDQPRELPPGVWEPPPVRRGVAAEDEQVAQPPVETPLEETSPPDTHQPRLGKRRARWLIAVLIAVPLVIVGGGGVLTWLAVHKSEAARFAEAKSELEQEHYSSAASLLRDLADKFPDSAHAPEYRFLHEWASVCSAVADPGDNLAGAVAKLDQFLQEHKKDPLMEQYGHNAGQLLLQLTKEFVQRNAAPSDDKPLEAVRGIEQLRRTVEEVVPDALTKAQGAQVKNDLDKVRAAVARWRERRDVLAKLRQLPDEKPFDAIKRVRSLVERKKRDLPSLDEDAEVQAVLNRLYEAHLASVVYQPGAGNGPIPGPPRSDDDAPSLVFAPLLSSTAPGNAPANDPIVLALARGVLYALKQSNGELKWATRVGIDTTVLPLRVPASQASPELFLVLSADTQTLTALDADGNSVWEYPVGQPVLGRPVIIDQRAYLAAYDGSVHEIELAGGKQLGRYSLGQRLTCGGAREGDSKRLYFPADDSCIYVLDVEQKRCVTILYDGHPSGSLRSEPIVIPPERRDFPGEAVGGLAEGGEAPGYLILNEASGLDAMRLRVFQLPLRDRHAAPLDLKPPAQLDGWTWFEPYQDGEKVAVLSDAGILGLFGIRQAGNFDQALFPLLQAGGLDLSKFLGTGAQAARERGRAQVVHMQDNDLWVLAHGRLQQVQLRWSNAVGPQAVPGWPKSLALGSPLHAPQRIEERSSGRSTFFLVTQTLRRQTCLASAVDDEGRILWQRQLGLVFQGEPLVLTPPRGGAPKLLALDQGGGLFVLDPSQPTERRRSMWKSLDSALDDNPRLPPRLLPSADGHTAYEIAAPGDGSDLIIRQVEWAEDGLRLRVRPHKVSLLAPDNKTPLRLAGTPAVVGTQLILPMAEGYLAQLLLSGEDGQPQLQPGENWRSPLAGFNAPCHVLALGGDRFLATNGRNGLAVWEWPRDKEWRHLTEGDKGWHLLSARVAAPPVLLPAEADQPPRVAVADSLGVLHLLSVSPDGSLRPAGKWDLKGRITAAPFVTKLPGGGVRIGCVLNQHRLVWLDPSRPEPLWLYQADGEMFVGPPRMVEDLLVAALQSGRYLGLDPATGKAQGSGYTLRASAVPAAVPVPFGPGRMLAPLSDGTALLLSPAELRKEPAKK